MSTATGMMFDRIEMRKIGTKGTQRLLGVESAAANTGTTSRAARGNQSEVTSHPVVNKPRIF